MKKAEGIVGGSEHTGGIKCLWDSWRNWRMFLGGGGGMNGLLLCQQDPLPGTDRKRMDGWKRWLGALCLSQ